MSKEHPTDEIDALSLSASGPTKPASSTGVDIGPDDSDLKDKPTDDGQVPTGEGAGAVGDEKDFFCLGLGRKKQKGSLEDQAGAEGPTTQTQDTSLATVNISQDFYRMDHHRRGKALLINQQHFRPKLKMQGLADRSGTDEDGKAMKSVLRTFGFQVEDYKNLNVDQIKNFCESIAKEDHSDADCFVCVILSHGEEGVVYGTDRTVEIKELARYFRGDMCPSLIGKPKLFFIQACRGMQVDDGVQVHVRDAMGVDHTDSVDPLDNLIKLPVEADFLFSYSTVPGYFSWRNFSKGSWFIQALASQLEKVGHKLELIQLLTRVNRIVSQNFESSNDSPCFYKKKQVPCITSMLTKDVLLTKRSVTRYKAKSSNP